MGEGTLQFEEVYADMCRNATLASLVSGEESQKSRFTIISTTVEVQFNEAQGGADLISYSCKPLATKIFHLYHWNWLCVMTFLSLLELQTVRNFSE